MKKAGKRAYIDTNIIVYAVIHHPEYGGICEKILRDACKGKFLAAGSYMVAIELLGSLSKINVNIANVVATNYLALPFEMYPIDLRVIKVAGIINCVTNIRYDAVHLAIMLLNNIDTVITNDIQSWEKIPSKINEIISKLEKEGLEVEVKKKIRVVTPKEYSKWIQK